MNWYYRSMMDHIRSIELEWEAKEPPYEDPSIEEEDLDLDDDYDYVTNWEEELDLFFPSFP